MEAYEAFGDLDSMMDLTEGCIKAAAEAACGTLKIEYQGTPVDLSGDWRRASMMELASEHAGEEVSFDRTRDELVAILEKNGGHAEAAWGKGKLISEIFEAVAEESSSSPPSSSTTCWRSRPWRRSIRRTPSSPSASSCSSWATSTATPSPS
ncbi:MAG: hypothetical protein ACLTDR_14645 [Adlercreutzia equolifaciens]